jgi:hypothetical protein
VVAAAVSPPREVPGRFELADDAVSGALRDPYTGAQVAQADPRIVGDAEKDLRVVGQKRPFGLIFWSRHHF